MTSASNNSASTPSATAIHRPLPAFPEELALFDGPGLVDVGDVFGLLGGLWLVTGGLDAVGEDGVVEGVVVGAASTGAYTSNASTYRCTGAVAVADWLPPALCWICIWKAGHIGWCGM